MSSELYGGQDPRALRPEPERPCRPCQDGEHERCLAPLSSDPASRFSRGDLGCCCDLLEQSP